MLEFDEEICAICGGFGDCADGDCEDKERRPLRWYEITLRIPMTLGQRLDHGNPVTWDWTTLVDWAEEITVEQSMCRLLNPSEEDG